MGTGTLALWLMLLAGGPAGDPVPMSRRDLDIPIRVNAERRHLIRELHLFSSADQGRTWTEAGVASPDQPAFKYLAPTDGVYWFIMVVVDVEGRRQPPDPYTVPPDLKLNIDTLKPNARLTAAERVGDEVRVAWEIQEMNPDLDSLKLEFRAADQGPNALWTPVLIQPALTGQTQFRPSVPGAVTVRVSMKDKAQNEGMDQKTVAAPATAQAPAGPTPVVPVMPTPGVSPVTALSVSPPPVPQATLNQTANAVGTIPAPAPEAAPVPVPVAASPAYAPAPVPPPAPAPLPPGRPAESNVMQPLPTLTNGVRPATGGQFTARPEQPGLEYTNQQSVMLDYDVDNLGPSGLSRVEIYLTNDDGRTWRKWDKVDRGQVPLGDGLHSGKMPVTVRLPDQDAVYGVRLVVHSGTNRSKGAPANGDSPDLRIALDRTKPAIQPYPPEMDPSQPNALILHWVANDANMAPNPIQIFYSENQNGPWTPITTASPGGLTPSALSCGVANNGAYTWMLPPNPPARVYLKFTARDLADNLAEEVTAEPIPVDLHVPDARVKGIVRKGGIQ
jgi:hypothetical protein